MFYYYNTMAEQHSLWNKLEYSIGTDVTKNKGILDTGMEVWNFATGELGFYQVGGRYSETQEPSMTSTYKYKDGDHVINNDPSSQLPYPRSGECFVRIKTPLGRYQYLAIGGKTIPEDAKHISYYYCNQQSCEWRNFRLSQHQYLGQITGHSCTVFEEIRENGNTKSVVLIAGGEGEKAFKTLELTYISCNDEEHTCQWTGKVAENLPQPLSHSKMATLNGIPYIFGGSSGGKASDVVYKYEFGEWIKVSSMAKPRQNHLVVSVPEEWLCHGYSPESTSTSFQTSTASLGSTGMYICFVL